jgi:Uma2 family endonuclease
MATYGILTEDDRVELIEGEVIQMPPIGSPHAACVDRLNRLFSRRVGNEAIVRVQNPVQLSATSEPQPDLAILRPRDDFYATGHPGPQDILLLIEVADTTLSYDRGVKLPLYARLGVSEVWLVDLEHEAVEMHRTPGLDGYGSHESRLRGDLVSPEGLPQIELAVEAILG